MKSKIQDSLDFIRKYAPLADQYGGYKVAFSGGKDSQVMLDLFKKAGVNYTAHYSVTTNDPPENVYFIRRHYPEVEFMHPKRTFLQLIEDKRQLPTIRHRFCCAELKECNERGFIAVGVRREESAKRATYEPISFRSRTASEWNEGKMNERRTAIIRPILEWREDEIWQYIEDNGIPVNPCYETTGRVGCLFCPFATKRQMAVYVEKYPRYYKLLLRAIGKAMNKGYMRDYQPITAEDVFKWWVSKKTAREYFTQLSLF